MHAIGNDHFRIDPSAVGGTLWTCVLAGSGRTFSISPPEVELDGEIVRLDANLAETGEPRELPNGAFEHTLRGQVTGKPHLALEMALRIHPESPVIRFAYTLRATEPVTMTKSRGADALTYCGLSYADAGSVTEIALSEFNELTVLVRDQREACRGAALRGRCSRHRPDARRIGRWRKLPGGVRARVAVPGPLRRLPPLAGPPRDHRGCERQLLQRAPRHAGGAVPHGVVPVRRRGGD